MINIFIKQNTEEILRLQFSQRKHYDMAEKYNNISWILAIIIVMLNIVNQFYNIITSYAVAINVIFSISVLVIDYLANINVKFGAATKEYIDYQLFQLENTEFNLASIEKLKEQAVQVITKYPDEYSIQKNNTGKDDLPGLKDWYSCKYEKNNIKTIFKCQKENVWWDGKLSKKYVTYILIFGLVLLVINLVVGWILNPSVRTLIIAILSGISLIIKIIEDTLQALHYFKKYNHANSKIEVIESKSNIDLKELILLQKDINEIRNIKFLVPNLIHKICSRNLHILRENVQ